MCGARCGVRATPISCGFTPPETATLRTTPSSGWRTRCGKPRRVRRRRQTPGRRTGDCFLQRYDGNSGGIGARRMRLWIKTPLAIFAEAAAGGLVVEDGRIVELVSQGSPSAPVDEIFDASRHVVLPGLVNAPH